MYTERPHRGDVGNIMIWGIAITLILVVFIVLGFALDWFATPFRVMSPRNVQALSRQANDSWSALEAQRASITTQRQRVNEFDVLYGVDPGKWPQGKRTEYQQMTAALRNLVNAYNHSCGQYNAMWLDEWRDVPAPDDLPKHCEMLAE